MKKGIGHDLILQHLQHVSVSSIRSYIVDKMDFYRKYILKDSSQLQISESVFIGKVMHEILQYFYTETRDGNYQEELMEICLKRVITGYERTPKAYENVNFGKDTFEEAIKKIEKVAFFYEDFYSKKMKSNIHGITQIEKKYTINNYLDTGLDLVGIIDLMYADTELNVIIEDHKVVSAFSPKDEINLAYEMQAGAYSILAEQNKTNPVKISKVIFREIKKSTNREKDKPQIQEYEIKDIGKSKILFNSMFERFLIGLGAGLQVGKKAFAPNVYGMSMNESEYESFLNSL